MMNSLRIEYNDIDNNNIKKNNDSIENKLLRQKHINNIQTMLTVRYDTTVYTSAKLNW